VANSARNFRLTAELLKILALFEGHGISAIPFKGPVDAILIYGNLALREFGDLDILVRGESMNAAEEILFSLGYRPEVRVPRSQLRLHSRTDCESAYVHQDGIRVDLHWRITPSGFPFAIDMEQVWLRQQYVQLGDARIRGFSPEDTLLILCAHGGKHLWERLEWVSSVAEFIRNHEDMDWEQVVKGAQAARGRRILFLGLSLAHEILGAELPDGILAGIEKDSAVRKLAMWAQERLFSRGPDPATRLEQCSYHRRLADRWCDGMLVLPTAALIPSPQDWDLVQLPRFLSPLYYLLRAIRLMMRYTGLAKE
jgi:hypothetical protein